MLDSIGSLETLTAISFGLMAGIYFIFSNTIMKSLAIMPFEQATVTMIQINKEILNPLFFILFWGSSIGSFFIVIRYFNEESSFSELLGSAIFLLGSSIITLLKNVPLNKNLARVATNQIVLEKTWTNYLKYWCRWNQVRTISATMGFVFLLL